MVHCVELSIILLYLASKIYQNLHGTESTLRVVEESLAKLGFGAVSSAFGLIRRLTLNLCKTILISTSCILRCLGRRSGSRRMLLFCKSVMKGRYGLSASATSQPSLLIDSNPENIDLDTKGCEASRFLQINRLSLERLLGIGNQSYRESE